MRRVDDGAVLGPRHPARLGRVGEDHDGTSRRRHLLQFPASDEGDPPSVRGEAGRIRPLRAVENRGAELVEMPNVEMGRAPGGTGGERQHRPVRRQRDRRVSRRQRAIRPELDAHTLGGRGRALAPEVRSREDDERREPEERREPPGHGAAPGHPPPRCVVHPRRAIRSLVRRRAVPQRLEVEQQVLHHLVAPPGILAKRLVDDALQLGRHGRHPRASAAPGSPCSTAACTSALVAPTNGRRPATIS